VAAVAAAAEVDAAETVGAAAVAAEVSKIKTRRNSRKRTTLRVLLLTNPFDPHTIEHT